MERSSVLTNLTKAWRPADRRAALLEAEQDSKATTTPPKSDLIVNRHDHHNLEIKAVFEIGSRAFEGEIEAYLFVPRSFDLRSWSKSDLEKDVRSRLRLAIPVSGEQGLSAVTSARDALARALDVAFDRKSGSLTEDLILESARDLCSVTSETLKQWTTIQTRSLTRAHLVFSTPESCLNELDSIHDCVARTGDLMQDIRDLVSIPAMKSPVLRALDEYLSHLYVQFLGALHAELDRSPTAPPGLREAQYLTARQRLESQLEDRIEKEALYRRNAGWAGNANGEADEGAAGRERRLVRMSHLKKFFQSRNFIDVSRRPSAKRISESTALAGTVFAGVIWALFQRFNRPDVVDVAFQSFFILAFAVVAYVLRDRLKDWAKARFQEEARKYLADYEQVLMARERRVGEVREWFNIREANSLSEDIRHLRRIAAGYEMELRLPEDVFHYRKRQEIDAISDTPRTARALHENLRLNLERYLKHMDDPFKDLLDFDVDGRLRPSRSHRVYHFYLCVRTSRRVPLAERGRAPSVEFTQTSIHRVILDKNGIVRLEDVNPNRLENVNPNRLEDVNPKSLNGVRPSRSEQSRSKDSRSKSANELENSVRVHPNGVRPPFN